MTTLASGVHQLEERRLTQNAAAVYPGVLGAALGGIDNRDHVARADIFSASSAASSTNAKVRTNGRPGPSARSSSSPTHLVRRR